MSPALRSALTPSFPPAPGARARGRQGRQTAWPAEAHPLLPSTQRGRGRPCQPPPQAEPRLWGEPPGMSGPPLSLLQGRAWCLEPQGRGGLVTSLPPPGPAPSHHPQAVGEGDARGGWRREAGPLRQPLPRLPGLSPALPSRLPLTGPPCAPEPPDPVEVRCFQALRPLLVPAGPRSPSPSLPTQGSRGLLSGNGQGKWRIPYSVQHLAHSTDSEGRPRPRPAERGAETAITHGGHRPADRKTRDSTGKLVQYRRASHVARRKASGRGSSAPEATSGFSKEKSRRWGRIWKPCGRSGSRHRVAPSRALGAAALGGAARQAQWGVVA